MLTTGHNQYLQPDYLSPLPTVSIIVEHRSHLASVALPLPPPLPKLIRTERSFRSRSRNETRECVGSRSRSRRILALRSRPSRTRSDGTRTERSGARASASDASFLHVFRTSSRMYPRAFLVSLYPRNRHHVLTRLKKCPRFLGYSWTRRRVRWRCWRRHAARSARIRPRSRSSRHWRRARRA